jgi:hypothetical protein
MTPTDCAGPVMTPSPARPNVPSDAPGTNPLEQLEGLELDAVIYWRARRDSNSRPPGS